MAAEDDGDRTSTKGTAGTKGTAAKIGKAVGSAANAAKDKLKKGWGDYPVETGGKAGQVRYGCGEGVPRDAPYFHRLKSDLANSYYWTGAIWQDYFFFVANWHPLLGMLFSHPSHPWTKFVRLEMFLISLAFTMVPSAAIASVLKDTPMFSAKTPTVICAVTIPDIIIGVVLYQMAIAQSRCPNTCGGFMDLIKKCCILQVAMYGAIATGISYVILSQSHSSWRQLFTPLVEGKLWSFLTWFPIWLLLPCQLGFLDLWCRERRAAERAAEGQVPMGSATGSEAERLPARQAGPVDGVLV